MEEYNPIVVCFSCKFGWGYLAEAGASDADMHNSIPVVCTGKVDAIHVLEAFRAGADGVLILGCEDGQCHFQDGNFQTKKKVYLLQKVLEACGIQQERVRMRMSRNPEGAQVTQLIAEMKHDLATLGPVKAFQARRA